jgi:hypothetical protein
VVTGGPILEEEMFESLAGVTTGLGPTAITPPTNAPIETLGGGDMAPSAGPASPG